MKVSGMKWQYNQHNILWYTWTKSGKWRDSRADEKICDGTGFIAHKDDNDKDEKCRMMKKMQNQRDKLTKNMKFQTLSNYKYKNGYEKEGY